MTLTQNLIPQMPCYLFWKDLNLKFLGSNDAFARIAGANSMQELTGKTDYDLPWANTEADLYRSDDIQVLKGIKKQNFIEPQHRANGTIVEVLTTKMPFFDHNNNLLGVLGIAQDLSTYKANQSLDTTKNSLSNITEEIFTISCKKQLLLRLKEISKDLVLTKREVEILSLWVSGFSIREASNLLYISSRTVEVHRKNIREKLKITTKHEIIDFLYSQGVFNLFLHCSKLIMNK